MLLFNRFRVCVINILQQANCLYFFSVRFCFSLLLHISSASDCRAKKIDCSKHKNNNIIMSTDRERKRQPYRIMSLRDRSHNLMITHAIQVFVVTLLYYSMSAVLVGHTFQCGFISGRKICLCVCVLCV